MFFSSVGNLLSSDTVLAVAGRADRAVSLLYCLNVNLIEIQETKSINQPILIFNDTIVVTSRHCLNICKIVKKKSQLTLWLCISEIIRFEISVKPHIICKKVIIKDSLNDMNDSIQ